MKYANIIVDISLEKLDKTFQYKVPEALEHVLQEGAQVVVPFGTGNRTLTGYVLELTDKCEFEPARMKEILRVVDKGIPVEGQMIALAAWIRKTYGSTMNQALKTVLPVRQKVQEKVQKYLVRTVSVEEGRNYLALFEQKHQTARLRLMAALLDNERVDYRLVTEQLHLTSATVKKLEEMGILRVETATVFRNPVKPSQVQAHPIRLQTEQQTIVNDILANVSVGDKRPALIHGVTGSGKTEVYMELIAACLEQG